MADFLLALTNFLKITSLDKNFSPQKVLNRTLVLIEEGKKRGINFKVIKIFSYQTRFFQAFYNGKKILFDGLPIGDSYQKTSLEIVDNKWLAKSHLLKNGLPAPGGGVFRNWKRAIYFARKIGWPVVVKPVSHSLSEGVTTEIWNEKDLIWAIREAQKYERNFLVERYIMGNSYRATVINQRLIGVVEREPANVIGDGQHKIRELIEIKNNHILRGGRDQRNTTLHKILIDQGSEKILAGQNLTLDSIPPLGKKVYLHYKVASRYGSDIFDRTDFVCKENETLFLKVAKIFDSKLLGIDFVCPDISRSWREQICGIVEVNSLPYIDLHHFPLNGRSRNVAGAIWGMIFPS